MQLNPLWHGASKILATVAATTVLSPAFDIQLDYSLDSSGFFNEPERRAALREVADFLQDILVDEFAEVDASKFTDVAGTNWQYSINDPITNAELRTFTNTVVPANTVIIYAFGTDLGPPATSSAGRGGAPGFNFFGSQAWFDRVRGRGEIGATAGNPNIRTDHAPKVGFVTFNTQRQFNFDLTENKEHLEFGPLAMHELLHALGVGTSPPWRNLAATGVFLGKNAVQEFGGPVPLDRNGIHWREDGDCVVGNTGFNAANPNNILSTTFGSFGQRHGVDQIAMMDPNFCDNRSHMPVITALDIAALQDIGYRVAIPAISRTLQTGVRVPRPAAGTVGYTWNTLPSFDYVIEKSTNNLQTFVPVETRRGTGLATSFSFPVTPSENAFYRVRPKANIEIVHTAPPVIVPSSPQGKSGKSAAVGSYGFEPGASPECIGAHCHEHEH